MCGLSARGLKLSQKAVQGVELVPEMEKPAKAEKQAGSKGLLSKASRLAPRVPAPRKRTR